MLKVVQRVVTGLILVAIGAAVYGYFTQDIALAGLALFGLAIAILGAVRLGVFRRARAQTAIDTPTINPRDERLDDLPVVGPTEDQLYMVFARLDGVKTGADFRQRIDTIIAEHDLTPLTAEDIDRMAAAIDAKDLRGQSFIRTSGIAFVRQRRAEIDVDFAGVSWLGGLPTLNDTPWPRDDFGRAMHHLAQIDLSTIPDPILPEGMPRIGAMAFFMTTTTDGPRQAKVLHLPQIGNTATEPPQDLQPIYAGPEWGLHVKGHARDGAPNTFPRWPVDVILLPMADQNKDDDARDIVADLLPLQTDTHLSPMNYRDTVSDFARPYFWDTAHRFTNSLRTARDDVPQTIRDTQKRAQEFGGHHQASLDILTSQETAFSQFVDEVSIWAVTREPWEKMSMAEAEQLHRYFDRVKGTAVQNAAFAPFYKNTQGELLSVEEAAQATLLAAANAAPDVYGTLPEKVRDDIDAKYRLASKGRWHQMFGLGSRLSGAPVAHTHHHLLMQFHSDQLVNWMWGSTGVVQLWITDEDLQAQNWDAVEMTILDQ